jgi:hypothetical protein
VSVPPSRRDGDVIVASTLDFSGIRLRNASMA